MIPIPGGFALYARLAAVLAAVVLVFSAGWATASWRLEAKIAGIERDHANEAKQNAEKALSDIATATTTINEAAKRYGSVQSTLSSEIANLKKDLQNEKPLPVDCVPSAGRVRSLNAAIDAANKAAAGQPAR